MKTSVQLALSLAVALAAAAPAFAATQDESLSPSAQNERQGDTTGLGASHRFAQAADAAQHCPGDTIVWLAGSKLVYELPGAAKYGKGPGAYACKAEADDAGFTAGQ
jgi:hypothetical protein